MEERETKNDESITRLALLLGVYCGNDHSNQGKTARRYIYERGHYTEKDGSIFGQQLFEEFKNE